jgi:glycosyltransferase involved in cell wall biosynthesis
MKIVVTGTRGIPGILGGIETHCEELFPRIAANGYDITVIRRKSYVKDQLSEYKGVKLVDLTSPRKKSLEAIIHTIKAVWCAKYKLHADIVHIHGIGPALAVSVARLLGLKVVFTHHGPDYDRTKWGKVAKAMLRLGEKSGVKYANKIIVISNQINTALKEKYGKTDACLIYNGVPQPEFFTDSKYLDSLGIKAGKYILSVGRFVPEKQFHSLIAAFVSLKEKKDHQLVLAGDADFEDSYSTGLKKLARENKIILTGFIKGDKLQTLLTNAKAFVLPSSHEGLPIALLEAMSYQLPIIASDIPANKEIQLPEECYFRTNDEKQLTAKLQEHVSRDMQPATYSLDNYSWEKIAGQTGKIYENLINQ